MNDERFMKILGMDIGDLLNEIGDIPNYRIFDGSEGQLFLQALIRSIAIEVFDLKQKVEKIDAAAQRTKEIQGTDLSNGGREVSAPEFVTCTGCGGNGIAAYIDEPTGDERVVEKVPDPCSFCNGTGKLEVGKILDGFGSGDPDYDHFGDPDYDHFDEDADSDEEEWD